LKRLIRFCDAEIGFVSGHDFSRAVNRLTICRALAPEVRFSAPTSTFSAASSALVAASRRFTTSPTPYRSPLAGEQNQIFTRSISIAEATKRLSLKARAQPTHPSTSVLYVGSITSQCSRVLITSMILVSSTVNPKRKGSLADSSGLHKLSFLVFE
jgi:hypothetical protein